MPFRGLHRHAEGPVEAQSSEPGPGHTALHGWRSQGFRGSGDRTALTAKCKAVTEPLQSNGGFGCHVVFSKPKRPNIVMNMGQVQ